MKAEILRRAEMLSDDEEEAEEDAATSKGKGKAKETSGVSAALDLGPDDEEDIVPIRLGGDGEDTDEEGEEDEEEEEEVRSPETIIELAYLRDPKVFERDAATRRSKARAELKAQTGLYFKFIAIVCSLFDSVSDKAGETNRLKDGKSCWTERYEVYLLIGNPCHSYSEFLSLVVKRSWKKSMPSEVTRRALPFTQVAVTPLDVVAAGAHPVVVEAAEEAAAEVEGEVGPVQAAVIAVLENEPSKISIRPAVQTTIGRGVTIRRWLAPVRVLVPRPELWSYIRERPVCLEFCDGFCHFGALLLQCR